MIVVIADDLTGAAEIAGIAHENGLSVEVHLDRVEATECDLVVVDTDTRSCSARRAAEKCQASIHSAKSYHAELVFKKVDSVLRGAVGAELNAALAELNQKSTLLVCANPRKGRVTTKGRIYLRGVPLELTEFANDPEHPRDSSSVAELLGQSRDGVSTLMPGDMPCELGVSVGNAETPLDLLRHAETWFSLRKRVLPAGGGEFFEAVLRLFLESSCRLLPLVARETLLPEDDTLVVSGSAMRCDLGWPTCYVGADRKSENGSPQVIIDDVMRLITTVGRAVICPEAWSGEDAKACGARLLTRAKGVLDRYTPAQLWLEGGNTASGLVRSLGYTRLAPTAVHGEGVVRMSVVGQEAPSLVIKPGSYRWPLAARATSALPETA